LGSKNRGNPGVVVRAEARAAKPRDEASGEMPW